MSKQRRIYIFLAALIAFTFAAAYTRTANAYDLVYRTEQSRQLTDGIIHRKMNLLTDVGWILANVVEADLSDGDITLTPTYSNNGLSFLKTPKTHAAENNALVSVNADFFNYGPSGRGTPLGIVVKNGKLLSSPATLEGMASLLQLRDNSLRIDYLWFDITITAPNGKTERVKHYNKYDPLYDIVMYDSTFAAETRDSRGTPNLCEFVVENGTLTDIRTDAPPVAIPENAYILAFLKDYNMFLPDNFKIGDEVKLSIDIAGGLPNIKEAFGGGTMLATGGIPAKITHGDTARNPRTAAGYSADGKKLYLVTVDGRGVSKGMTLSELSYFMISLGASDAINLDGGGSTAMVMRQLGSDEFEVVNKPSDGGLRAVPLTLSLVPAVKNSGGANIIFDMDRSVVFKDTNISLKLLGYDDNYNAIDVNMEEVKYTVSSLDANDDDFGEEIVFEGDEVVSDMGYVENHKFYPKKAGKAQVTAEYMGGTATYTVDILDEPAALIFAEKQITLQDVANISLRGRDGEGYTAAIDPGSIKITSADESVAEIANGQIIKKGEGKTYIMAELGQIRAGALVSTTDDFEGIERPKDTFLDDRLKRIHSDTKRFSVSVFGDVSFTPPESKELPTEGLSKDEIEQQLKTKQEEIAQLETEFSQKFMATFKERSDADIPVILGNTTKEIAEGITDIVLPNGNGSFVNSEIDARFMWFDNTKGGLVATLPAQWRNLNDLVKNSTEQNIFLFLKRDAFSGGFDDNLERDAFFRLLSDELCKKGKNVFVFAPAQKSSTARLNGVRYFTVERAEGDNPLVYCKIAFDEAGVCYSFYPL